MAPSIQNSSRVHSPVPADTPVGEREQRVTQWVTELDQRSYEPREYLNIDPSRQLGESDGYEEIKEPHKYEETRVQVL